MKMIILYQKLLVQADVHRNVRKSLGNKVNKVDNLNVDSASAYQKFYKNHSITLNEIPSGKHSNGNINISKINGIHSQLKTWL